MSYDALLSPMNIGNVTIKNRTVMTAAEMGFGQPNGKPTEAMMDYYEERAKGGVGLIIPGICRVNDTKAPTTFTQLSMSHDYHIATMSEFAARIHRHGAKLAIQLHHPGRQGVPSTNNVLPMLIAVTDKKPELIDKLFEAGAKQAAEPAKNKRSTPVQAVSVIEPAKNGAPSMYAMKTREVKKLVRDFVDAAERCKKAGVDLVELHGGHGYLIQQFLSPYTNRRTDEYGGSFENRLRFLREIIRGIQERCGRDYPIMVRLTVDEMYSKIGRAGTGYDLETGKKIAKRLEEQGVAAINVTSACYDAFNYWLEPTSFEPGWRKYLAKEIKSVVSIPVVAAGVIRTPEQADEQIRAGFQDFMGSARTFICDPHWVEKAQQGRADEIRRCIGCLNCFRSFMAGAYCGRHGECALNVSVGNERAFAEMPRTGEGRRAVVIGAGPAGLKSAELLAMRGYAVTLFEKNRKPGGQVITASSCDLKDKLYWSIEDMLTSVKKLGVDVRLGTEAGEENIKALDPYVVVAATGGVPVRPGSIPGIDRETVFTAPEIIMKEKVLREEKVVVVGSGMTGLETTEILNDSGNSVTIIEMAEQLAPGTWFQLVDDEMERIGKYDTHICLGTKLLAIEQGHVLVENVKTGEQRAIPADSVVLSMGVRPADTLARKLEADGIKVVSVGDALHSGTIADACHSAYDAVMAIE